jgi:lipoate:protein ligase-like protein
VPAQKIEGKAKVKAVEQRMTTVSRMLGREVRIDEVRDRVRAAYAESFGVHLRPEAFDPAEREAIERLADTRYRSDDWIYQLTPQQDTAGMSVVRTPAGVLRTYVGLMGNTIKSVLITGDFFECGVFREIETRLKWSPMDREAIKAIATEVLPEGSDFGVQPRHLVRAVWQAGQRAQREDGFTYDGSCYYPAAASRHANPRPAPVTTAQP